MAIPPPSGPVDPDEPAALPADLQPGYVGAYRFPSTSRRRWAGYSLALVGIGALALYAFKRSSVLVNRGFLVGGIVLLVLAVWHFLAAWPLSIDELDALTRAGIAVGFPIGHAAASLAWRGWRSRPVWRILLYSAEDPPLQRGIVEVDGVDGDILLSFSEDNPEDWSQFADV
jgi:hypothetical protein